MNQWKSSYLWINVQKWLTLNFCFPTHPMEPSNNKCMACFFNCDFFFIYYGLFKIIESKSESELQSGQENLQKPAKKRLLSHKNFLQSIIYNDRSADTIQLVMVQNQKCDVSNFNFGIFQARSFSRLVWAFDLTSYSFKN